MPIQREAFNLTKQFIKDATPREDSRDRKVFDTHANSPRRFFLRVSPKGTKSLELGYYIKGRDRQVVLKSFKKGGDKIDDLNLTEVRKQARKLADEVNDGFDPLGKRGRPNYSSLAPASHGGHASSGEPAPDAAGSNDVATLNERPNTVAELAHLYYHHHVVTTASAQDTRRYLQMIIGFLGKVEIQYVERSDLVWAINRIKHRGHSGKARMLKSHISGMFSWAHNIGFISNNPAHKLPAPKQKARERVLDYQELYDFMHHLSGAKMSPAMQFAVMLILLTGQRPKEVLGMRDGHVRNGVWTIPADLRRKTDTTHRVPLAPFAAYIIEQAIAERDAARERRQKRRKGKDLPPQTDLIFPGRGESRVAVESFDKIVARNREVLGNHKDPTWGHWRPHDLRRTCRTGLATIGYDDSIAEKVIGHKAQGIVSIYNHHKYDAEKLDALTEWENFLLRLFRWEDSISSFSAMVLGWQEAEGDSGVTLKPRIPSLMDEKSGAQPLSLRGANG